MPRMLLFFCLLLFKVLFYIKTLFTMRACRMVKKRFYLKRIKATNLKKIIFSISCTRLLAICTKWLCIWFYRNHIQHRLVNCHPTPCKSLSGSVAKRDIQTKKMTHRHPGWRCSYSRGRQVLGY
jgi:hypothetical protein